MAEECPPPEEVPGPPPEATAIADRLRGVLVRLLDPSGGAPPAGAVDELARLVRHIARHGDAAERRVAALVPGASPAELRHASDSVKAIFLGAALQLPVESISDVVGLFRKDLGVSQGFALGEWEDIKGDALLKSMLEAFTEVEGEQDTPEAASPEPRARRKGRRAEGKRRREAG